MKLIYYVHVHLHNFHRCIFQTIPNQVDNTKFTEALIIIVYIAIHILMAHFAHYIVDQYLNFAQNCTGLYMRVSLEKGAKLITYNRGDHFSRYFYTKGSPHSPIELDQNSRKQQKNCNETRWPFGEICVGCWRWGEHFHHFICFHYIAVWGCWLLIPSEKIINEISLELWWRSIHAWQSFFYDFT